MSLAMAYAIKRRNAKKMAMGGQVNPKLEASMDKPVMSSSPMEDMSEDEMMCAHGGEIEHSPTCYDMGGEVDGIEVDGDLDSDDMLMGEDISSPDNGQLGDEDEAKRGRLLSKVLGGIERAHKGFNVSSF